MGSVIVLTVLVVSSVYAQEKAENLTITAPGFQLITDHAELELDYILAKEQENITLRCSGVESVLWEWEYAGSKLLQEEMETRIQVVELTIDPGALEPYSSELKLNNAKFSDTGTFTCRTRESSVHNKVYIYVENKNNLFRRDKHFYQVNVDPANPTYLGCRPSTPRGHMKILSQKVDITKSLGEHNMKYSPQTGLWITDASVHDAGTIECIIQLGSFQSSLFLFLTIMDTPTTILPKPRLVKEYPPGPYLGGSLILSCTIEVSLKMYINGVTLDWTSPSPSQEQDISTGRIVLGEYKNAVVNQEYRTDQSRLVSRNITVYNLTISDGGDYTCTATSINVQKPSKQSIHIKTLPPGEIFISDFSFNGGGSLVRIKERKDEVRWLFDVEAIPVNSTQYTWILPSGDPVPHKHLEKYTKEITGNNVKLTIKDVSIHDMGTYPFTVTVTSAGGKQETKQTELELVVLQEPVLNMSVQGYNSSFYIQKEFYTVSCEALGYPINRDSIYMDFYPCSDLETCHTNKLQRVHPGALEPIDGVLNPAYHYRYISHTLVQAEQSGMFECKVCTEKQFVCNTTKLPFFLSDSSSGFEITESSNQSYVEEDELTLTCSGSKYIYTELNWFKGEQKLQALPSSSEFSLFKTLIIDSLRQEDIADYTCRAQTKTGLIEELDIFIDVLPILPPEIVKSNMNGTQVDQPAEEAWEFICDVRGRPQPEIVWSKDGDLIDLSDPDQPIGNSLIKLMDENRVLRLQYLLGKDSGKYVCTATNRGGSISLESILNVEEPTDNTLLYLALGGSLAGLVVLGCIAIAVWQIFIYRGKLRVLTAAELDLFERGDPESINPELGVDEQADLLPYNRGVEFPKDRLKLGKQLGSGAFGRVLKAEATGINSWEPVSIVAVKMVKPQADITYIKALMSELKIMMHIGKHLNIVNLLGACTDSLNKRELLIIVEYCRFGNLQKYLIHHRNSFINQIDPNTGLMDFKIGKHNSESEIVDYSAERERFETSAHYVRSASEFDGPATPEGYIDMRSPDPNPDAQFDFNRTSTKSVRYTKEPYLISREPSVSTGSGMMEVLSDMTEVTHCTNTGGRESRTYSVGSRLSKTGPGWRSNVRGDYRNQDVKPLTTKDLICWAYQIARGMDYLSSKKVMHGDLACRNILLASDNVVKICDFGLAKDIYKTNNYHKKTDGPLPIKWLAIECLRDRIFSTQSDVWAFGIVLWEMFSLGKTPYPGMEPGDRFYEKLANGYRMQKPHYAPIDIYKTMSDCWLADPVQRPRFVELTSTFGDLLEEGERENYIVMTERVDEENRIGSNGSRYLDMMSAPDYQMIVSCPFNEIQEENGYLLPDKMRSPVNTDETKEENGYLIPNNKHESFA